jgi:O-antigen/teichoic acid export membrane protein
MTTLAGAGEVWRSIPSICYISCVTTDPTPSRRHGSDTLITIAGSAFAPLAALATAPILAHGLSLDGRGAVASVTAPLLLATTIGTIGVPASVTFHAARRTGPLGRLVLRGALLVAVVAVLVTVALVMLSDWFAGGDAPLARLVSIAACAVLPSLVVLVLQAAAGGSGRWRLVAVERFITAAVRLCGIGGAAMAGSLSIELAVAVLALSPVLGGFAYLGLLRRTAIRPSAAAAPGTGPTMGSMLGYGARVWIGSVSGALLLRLDQALLTPLVGVEALGLYVVAVTVAELPRVISDAARDVSFSADAADRSDERLARTARIASSAVLVVSVVLAFAAPLLVPVAFGDDFVGAVPLVLVLLVATCIGSASTIGGSALIARGRPGVRSLAFVLGCLVNIAVLLVLTPAIGVMAAAVSTLCGGVAIALVNAIALHRVLGYDPRRLVGLRRSDLVVVRAAVVRRLPGGAA